ncbi:YgfZ/GcvT domain-containing protein [Maritalea porphyrae]|uniref:CAF17-like 4Fe-4S cluster assembly/insertion protein YgfZ n=1 Tax=Maritalea porphyrae TaxID=880732 RepID=UPI0022AEBBE8|nr:folate-binding protein [Maritalea porphyrae]MCZ4271334.1 folate-binding protein [Maritalea porphyrae]
MGKIIKLDRCAVQISGTDAQKLLHDTLTCNLSTPLEGKARWFALLAPQGKILVEGLISETDDGFLLDIPISELENFTKRMRLYKMRADVTITPREDLSVGWTGENSELTVEDARPSMGYRLYSSDSTSWSVDQQSYHHQRISNSIMEMGGDFEANGLFPHDIGMDQLGGVDFKKGCYIGQEVVSRMQHRGTARKRPVMVTGASLNTGDSVVLDDKSVGSITSCAGKNGIALVRLDKVSDPDACTINQQPVQLAVPAWASYLFSDS